MKWKAGDKFIATRPETEEETTWVALMDGTDGKVQTVQGIGGGEVCSSHFWYSVDWIRPVSDCPCDRCQGVTHEA